MAEEQKMYKLLGPDGEQYLSETPGTVGGNSTGKLTVGLTVLRRYQQFVVIQEFMKRYGFSFRMKRLLLQPDIGHVGAV